MKAVVNLSIFVCGLAVASTAAGDQLGVIPVPVVTGVSVQTNVTFDSSSNIFTYSYTVTNPATNTGSIWNIQVDLTASDRFLEDFGTDLTLPRGASGNVSFASVYQAIKSMASIPPNTQVVPFGINAPSGWGGSLTVNGTGGFVVTDASVLIAPGQTVGSLNLLSHGVPMIRTMQLIPDWDLDMGNGDDEATEDEEVKAAQVQQSLINSVYVLGPSPTPFDTSNILDVFDQLQTDVATAVKIGWIPDPTLAQYLPAALQSARTTFDSEGAGYDAYTALQAILTTVTTASSGKLTQNAYELLDLDLTKMLHDFGSPPPSPIQPPQPPPPTPVVTITNPATHAIFLHLGTTATITAQVVNKANNDAPLANYAVPFSVDKGPDSGTAQRLVTDQNGIVTFTFAGRAEGADTVAVHQLGFGPSTAAAPRIIFEDPVLDSATVIWSGGADLILREFTPPIINWDGHSPIHITDDTKNIGSIAAGASLTEYYVSTQQNFNPKAATIIGQRPVPTLSPGQDSFAQGDFTFPAAYQQPGTYYLAACANGDRSIVETNYDNNCVVREVAVALKRVILPPDCSKAGPTIASLWPPNHKMVVVGITGVTDPNNLPVTVSITGIQQDEPVDEPGSGNTAPDGAGVGTATAQVRAERSGTGTGRIYFIAFKASDSAGGSCNATVQVYVPHDQGQGTTPVDTGQRYDSTLP